MQQIGELKEFFKALKYCFDMISSENEIEVKSKISKIIDNKKNLNLEIEKIICENRDYFLENTNEGSVVFIQLKEIYSNQFDYHSGVCVKEDYFGKKLEKRDDAQSIENIEKLLTNEIVGVKRIRLMKTNIKLILFELVVDFVYQRDMFGVKAEIEQDRAPVCKF